MSAVNRFDAHAFLAPGANMSALISRFDWSSTTIGQPADWPIELKCATAMILRSDVPMTLLWGRQGIMIYNDAYQDFAGGRHPYLLGSEVLKGWPEVADFNANVLRVCLGGDTLSYQDQHLMLIRRGEPEDAWLTLDYSPIVDAAGVPAGVLAVVKETTSRVKAEQKLQFAQEVGGVGTFEWHPDSGRVEGSEQYRRLWGFEPDDEISDQRLADRVHPDDRHLLGRHRIATDNPITYAEFRVVHPVTGNVRWIARRGEPVFLGDPDRRRYIGVAMDVTERKEAEEAIARSEYRWRELFESMQEGFFVGHAILDADKKMVDFTLLEINPAFGIQTGLDTTQAVGRSVRELIPSIADSDMAIYAGVMKTGEPVQFETHVPALQDRWFEARARRMDADRFAVLFVDISARKRAEATLRESEARFRSLAQTMPNQIWTADRYGQPDWFNDRVYTYFGLAEGSLDGERWATTVHPDDLESVQREWARAVADGTPYETELRVRRHDGVYRWFSARAEAIRDKGGTIQRWVGNNADIEDQKATEVAMTSLAVTLERRVESRTKELLQAQDALRQSQKMEAIGNLTGGVAHDFNNLLQVISGNLQLLAGEVRTLPNAQRRLDNAMAGVSRGAKLASQLLSFGRRQPLSPRVVNPARLIRDMDELLRRTLGEEVQLETVIAGGLWNILIDPANLENALLNLAINARDAMSGRGHLTIEAGNAWLDDQYVATLPDVKAGQYVMVAITDTGSGMGPEVIEKVFEPFFTTKAEGRGTGLGLSMVYGFIKQSEGHIKIYSEPGDGTTVKLYLPRSSKSEDAITNLELAPVVGGNETILVAEDDDSVRDTVVTVLTQLGYRVLQAPDAQAAFAIINSGVGIDLLFTDVVMPGELRSPELAKRAKEKLPLLAVLFTSGYTENAIVHGGRLDEGVDLLSKPYTNDALARKVRAALDGSRQLRDTAVVVPHELSRSIPATKPSASLRILLCEDEEPIRQLISHILQEEGHIVIPTATLAEAQSAFDPACIDLLITDMGLPDGSGLQLAHALRKSVRNLPILFATGQGDENNAPIDEPTRTLIKPFGIDILLSNVAALAACIRKPAD